MTLVVTDAAGATVAASRLGTYRRGPLEVRWNAQVRRRPAVPGAYQLWLSATDLAGNTSPRTPVGVAAIERDTEPPAVRLLRVGRANGNVRLRWASTDNASRHLRIKVKVAGRNATAARPAAERSANARPARAPSRVHRMDHRHRRERERRLVQAAPGVTRC